MTLQYTKSKLRRGDPFTENFLSFNATPKKRQSQKKSRQNVMQNTKCSLVLFFDRVDFKILPINQLNIDAQIIFLCIVIIILSKHDKI